jgi:hypothetical protein
LRVLPLWKHTFEGDVRKNGPSELAACKKAISWEWEGMTQVRDSARWLSEETKKTQSRKNGTWMACFASHSAGSTMKECRRSLKLRN